MHARNASVSAQVHSVSIDLRTCCSPLVLLGLVTLVLLSLVTLVLLGLVKRNGSKVDHRQAGAQAPPT